MRISGCRNAYFGARGEPHLVDELGVDQLLDAGIDSQAGQQIGAEASPDDRSGGKRVFGRRVEPIDARGDGRLQRGRHPHLGDIGAAGVAAALADQHAALRELTGDLLGEERVTGGAPGDDLADLTHRRIGAQQFRDQRCGFRITQRCQGDGLCAGDMRQGSVVLGAIGD